MEKEFDIIKYKAWLSQLVQQELTGCKVVADDGTILYTPDGESHYRALWTRDFAYMVANTWEYIPASQIKACINLLLSGQRDDGCIPDRVQADLVPVYSAGPVDNPLGDPPTDNSQFIVNLVYNYVTKTGDVCYAEQVLPFLEKAMAFVRTSERGLVEIPPPRRQSPYGFTDTVAKLGELLFSSLLYWQACKEMILLCNLCKKNPLPYQQKAEMITLNLDSLWDPSQGAYVAASHQCSQIDIWGNAYAVYCGFLDEEDIPSGRKDRVLSFLRNHYGDYMLDGQVRHLPNGTYWEKTLIPIAQGEYQNGAYWATASGWVGVALACVDQELAYQLFIDLFRYFDRQGVFECVNGPYKKLVHYVVSVANVYGALCKLEDVKAYNG